MRPQSCDSVWNSDSKVWQRTGNDYPGTWLAPPAKKILLAKFQYFHQFQSIMQDQIFAFFKKNMRTYLKQRLFLLYIHKSYDKRNLPNR
jgi:hypothetical protein